MIIKISTSFPGEIFKRQLPAGFEAKAGVKFVVNEPIEQCDAWVVLDGLQAPDATRCDPRNVFLWMGEPPSYKHYNAEWMKNFARVLGYGKYKHAGFEAGNTGLPWFTECDYETLAAADVWRKSKNLSVIASSKKTIKGHRQRVWFIKELSMYLEFDLYGRGWDEEIKTVKGTKAHWIYNEEMATKISKRPALEPYKYTLAIENSDTSHYWTEKLSDCFLWGAMPIYWGCNNIYDYFSSQSLISIDIKDPRGSAYKIQKAMEEGLWEKSLPALKEAREGVLTKYNMVVVVHDLVKRWHRSNGKADLISLWPEPKPTYWQQKLTKWKRKLRLA